MMPGWWPLGAYNARRTHVPLTLTLVAQHIFAKPAQKLAILNGMPATPPQICVKIVKSKDRSAKNTMDDVQHIA